MKNKDFFTENDQEKKLRELLQNISCILSDSLIDIIHSGIAINDPFLIDEQSTLNYESKFHMSSIKTLLFKDKTALNKSFEYSKKKRFEKSLKSSSVIDLIGMTEKKTNYSILKKKSPSHQHWNSKQLMKVYGMRYNNSVRNSYSFLSKSPKKSRVSSVTPKKFNR